MIENMKINIDKGKLENMAAEMLKPEVKVGNVTFKIGKLNGIVGLEVMEDIRVEVATLANTIDSLKDVFDIFMVISLLPVKFVADVRDRLFTQVKYKVDGNASDFLILAKPVYESVFAGLDVAHIYELIARCLFVNFFSSFKRMLTQK